MNIGLVKWFDDLKGFGMLGTLDQGDIFLHINNFKHISTYLQQGIPISFELRFDEKKGKNYAALCRIADTEHDFFSNMSLLGKKDYIPIEVKFSAVTTSGRKFTASKIEHLSILQSIFKCAFLGEKVSVVIESINKYFINNSDQLSFIDYAEFFQQNLEKALGAEKTEIILPEITSVFRDNLSEDILFDIWKVRKFSLIGFEDEKDFEIKREILESNMTEIGLQEISRIKLFSYGDEFINWFLNKHQLNFDKKNLNELLDFYQFVDLLEEPLRSETNIKLTEILFLKTLEEFTLTAKKGKPVTDENSYQEFLKLLQKIPSELSEEHKTKIKEELINVIQPSISLSFKPVLWKKGIIQDIDQELKMKFFLDEDSSFSDRYFVLSKLENQNQVLFFKAFYNRFGSDATMRLLEEFTSEYFQLPGDAFQPKNLFSESYWQNKECGELISAILKEISFNKTDDEKIQLFLKGHIATIPDNLLMNNITIFSESDLLTLFYRTKENQSLILNILLQLNVQLEISTVRKYYKLAIECLDDEHFTKFDLHFSNKLTTDLYFELWEDGLGKIIPERSISQLLNDQWDNYNKTNYWKQNKLISEVQIENILWLFIEQKIPITNRISFAKTFNHIKFLIERNSTFIKKITDLKNPLFDTILWFLDTEENLNYEVLRDSFIYFAPQNQVQIIKKLFHLKALGKFDLTLDKLNSLTRFDLDLYKLNLEYNPGVPVDISSDIIIKALISLQTKGKFLVESEMLSLVLHDLKYLENTVFQLKDYFENCKGRMKFKFDWQTKGRYIKLNTDKENDYFSISFPYDANLVQEVRNLPSRSWNATEKIWMMPVEKSEEVLAFAKSNRFEIQMEGNSYANNAHLATLKREDIPMGIKFCEGRESNKVDSTFSKNFFWCKNEPCYERCEAIHPAESWEQYTLLDFCEIFNLNTDDVNSVQDHISKGKYYQFIGLINRFNRLLERLFCRECDHIMHPTENSHFAAYAAVKFSCVNESCGNRQKVVYLNHCLTGKCGCIIDSRDSKQCKNGLYICSNCGSCCSHDMLSRRLNNLQLNGGYIHTNLIELVNSKKGHLERAEYFCHKCANPMDEVSTDSFYCNSCKVRYETSRYKFKRTHKHLVIKENTDKNNGDTMSDSDNNPF